MTVRLTPVAGLLDPAPTDCPLAAPPSSFTMDNFGGGFSDNVTFNGGGPAWEIGVAPVLNLNQYVGPTPYPGTKVMWVIGPNYNQWVVLSGHDLQTGAPLWFQIYPVPNASDTNAPYMTQALLYPHASNRGDTANSAGTWDIWGIGITVVAAGCYELDASWPSGHWQAVVAAGR